MSEETKYIRIRSVNSAMKLLFGDKLTWAEWFISKRSLFTHMQTQFSDRYGGISHICTKAGGHNCCFFKMVGYTTAYQWSTILIPVTAEQEARIFKEACRMAGLDELDAMAACFDSSPDKCYYGPNAIKYDTFGLGSYISKLPIIKMSSTRQICNETVGLLMLVEWPDIFVVDDDYHQIKKSFGGIAPQITIDSYKTIPPHEQLPDATHYMIQHYFENVKAA